MPRGPDIRAKSKFVRKMTVTPPSFQAVRRSEQDSGRRANDRCAGSKGRNPKTKDQTATQHFRELCVLYRSARRPLAAGAIFLL
jgi:hypothetical protein